MSAWRGRQRLFSRFSAIAGSRRAQALPFRGHPAAGKSHALSAAGSAPREVPGPRRFGKEAADPAPRESAKPAARALVLLDFQRVTGNAVAAGALLASDAT
jgi:hypothetical protein